MGVTVLQPYPMPEGKSAIQVVDGLVKRILALGAKPAGHFLVDCETFIPAPQHGTSNRAVHVLHNSEYPATTFSTIDNGTGKQNVVVADNIFDLLMLKITSTFTSKKQIKMEARGPRFEYGDFVIKLGSVTILEHFKGILLEIEYKACATLSYCWEMIREMLQGFLGIGIPKEYPAYFTTQTIVNAMGQQQLHPKQNDIYEPMDTVRQYQEHFLNYRKPMYMMGAMNPNAGGATAATLSLPNAMGGGARP